MIVKDILSYYPEKKKVSIFEVGVNNKKYRVFRGKTSTVPEQIKHYEVIGIEAGFLILAVLGKCHITAEA